MLPSLLIATLPPKPMIALGAGIRSAAGAPESRTGASSAMTANQGRRERRRLVIFSEGMENRSAAGGHGVDRGGRANGDRLARLQLEAGAGGDPGHPEIDRDRGVGIANEDGLPGGVRGQHLARGSAQ